MKKWKKGRRILIVVAIILLTVAGGRALMFKFVLGPIDAEPTVKVIPEPIKAVGFSTRTSMKTVFRDAPRLLTKYLDYKKQHGIADLKEPWTFLARSDHYDPATMSWDYTVGDAVTKHEAVPEGMVPFGMPAGTYVVFRMRPRIGFLLGWAMAKTKKHAIEEWFPKSEYEPTGADFEYNDKDVPGPRDVDLYFAVRKRK